MVEQQAIIVRNAKKQYGSGAHVLNGLNLTVPKGSIYGLLGASGCGKTTLLSCIVGVRKLDTGEIWVLGGRPGSKGSGVPGPRVGYMPQEISLIAEFSVIDALYYFGRVNGMDDWEIEERYAFLKDLLQLPRRDQLVKNMSGGQQRRVSFGAALIHKPELLILDEPTVGLDPVLRDNIWNYLVMLTQEERTTVVITTHYIEEAKQANRVGLMRCGQLLSESTPTQLLEQFQCESLEEAFLVLSRIQKENQNHGMINNTVAVTRSTSNQLNDTVTAENDYLSWIADSKMKYPVKQLRSTTFKKYKALMKKNYLQFRRYPSGLVFAVVLPLVQCLIFFYAVGGDPRDLSISVVNHEAGNCADRKYWSNVTYDSEESTCNLVDASCRYMHGFKRYLPNDIYFNNLSEAMNSIKEQKSVGVIYFHQNFSQALQAWLEDGAAVDAANIVNGQMQVWLDMGDRQIGLFTKKKMYDIFFEMHENLMRDCHLNPKVADLPLIIEEPIFGTKDQSYAKFIAPGFLLTLIFFLATAVCSSIIISDRYAGIWDRSLVQGVNIGEILITHLLVQLIILIIQITISLCIVFLHFNISCKGSFHVVVWMMFLEGISGILYGFLISILCTSFTVANYISTGSFYPIILLCGCLWPVEGMPQYLRYLSYLLPTTLPGISLRAVMDQGKAVSNPMVYTGFLVLIAWIVGFVLLCFLGLRKNAG